MFVLVLLGGSEEKEPAEERPKDGDACGSKDEQKQSSEEGKATFFFSLAAH